jgi:septal ring factor EnvC (AmiA/AmiB activator)
MRTLPSVATLLLLGTLALGGCQSASTDNAPLASDLNSSNPAIAEQARKVQTLLTEMDQQKARIKAEEDKLTALQQQVDGSRQNLEGLKKQAQATP